MELSKLEAHAKHGDMGPYSKQIAELIAIIRKQEAELATRQSSADAVKSVTKEWPVGYSVNRTDGHGWYIDPPKGGRWVAHDGTPAADFIAAIAAQGGKGEKE